MSLDQSAFDLLLIIYGAVITCVLWDIEVVVSNDLIFVLCRLVMSFHCVSHCHSLPYFPAHFKYFHVSILISESFFTMFSLNSIESILSWIWRCGSGSIRGRCSQDKWILKMYVSRQFRCPYSFIQLTMAMVSSIHQIDSSDEVQLDLYENRRAAAWELELTELEFTTPESAPDG